VRVSVHLSYLLSASKYFNFPPTDMTDISMILFPAWRLVLMNPSTNVMFHFTDPYIGKATL
jgi:hypothetical protein